MKSFVVNAFWGVYLEKSTWKSLFWGSLGAIEKIGGVK